jgi:hypothetical protein
MWLPHYWFTVLSYPGISSKKATMIKIGVASLSLFTVDIFLPVDLRDNLDANGGIFLLQTRCPERFVKDAEDIHSFTPHHLATLSHPNTIPSHY